MERMTTGSPHTPTRILPAHYTLVIHIHIHIRPRLQIPRYWPTGDRNTGNTLFPTLPLFLQSPLPHTPKHTAQNQRQHNKACNTYKNNSPDRQREYRLKSNAFIGRIVPLFEETAFTVWDTIAV